MKAGTDSPASKPRRSTGIAAVFGLCLLTCAGTAAAATTLEEIRARGSLTCIVQHGTEQELLRPGSAGGGNILFEAELCRALATAILGTPDAITPLVATIDERMAALEEGAGNIAYGNMTVTASRSLRSSFPIVMGHDAQGFMGPATLNARTLEGLGQATVCVVRNSTSEANLREFVERSGLPLRPVPVGSTESQIGSYRAGRCTVMTGDRSGLVTQRAGGGLSAEQHPLLEDTIAPEVTGPMVRNGDPDWAHVVRWIYNALILAEEKGVTSANVDQVARDAADPETRRLLGLDPHPLMALGLPADCLARMIRLQGNYGEMYERSFRRDTPWDMPRGRNALVRDGGLLYPLPYR